MKRSVIVIIVMVLAIFGLLMFSCHGSGGNSGILPVTGKIALYLTDDLSLYSQVTATVNLVQLRNTGLGSTCDVSTVPLSANLANLSALLQYVNETQCLSGPYNRIHMEFDRTVQLMTGPTGTLVTCSFASYKDGNGNQPNILHCDQEGICSLDINGAVNVAAFQSEKMALDFDLKNFDVADFGTPACAVTMKVSPVTPDQLRGHARREVITGLVSRLSTTNKTFDLTHGNQTFSVLYSSVTATEQPGVDDLLLNAQAEQLRTKVFTGTIDLDNNRIEATAIIVKVEGTVSDLVPGATLVVRYGTGGSRAVAVDYSRAVVDGVLSDGVWVDAKLFGFSAVSNKFLADTVEVEMPGTMTED